VIATVFLYGNACQIRGDKGNFFISNFRLHSAAKDTKDIGLEVFMAVTMKNAVFWGVAPCRSYVNRRFRGTATYSRWFLAHGFFYPEDGGDTFL
jgi:hypothetical protein